MSKLKRPVYKYKIEHFCKKNVHTDEISVSVYRVLIKDTSFIFNPWVFLDPYDRLNKFSEFHSETKFQGYLFDSLDKARDGIEKFRLVETQEYESISYSTVSNVSKGIISI